MTLFITVFTVQWWAVAVYGIWQIVTDDVPPLVYIFVVVFTNIGGCLNLVVYLSILKKRRRTMAVGVLLPTSRPRDQNPYQVKTSDKEKAQSSTAKHEAHSTGQASLWTTNECSIHEPSLALTLQWMLSTRVRPRSGTPIADRHNHKATVGGKCVRVWSFCRQFPILRCSSDHRRLSKESDEFLIKYMYMESFWSDPTFRQLYITNMVLLFNTVNYSFIFCFYVVFNTLSERDLSVTAWRRDLSSWDYRLYGICLIVNVLMIKTLPTGSSTSIC